MQRKTWARTRSGFRWKMGRTRISTDFMLRKARSAAERDL